jgi:hypothetical protein
MVNEHSFILNHSPQDGKKFRAAREELANGPSVAVLDVFTGWILAGQHGDSERAPLRCQDAAFLALSPVMAGAECGTFRK